MDLLALREPFPASDVEWRIQQAGDNNGKVWAKVLAYVTNRAIMDRLDEVCAPNSWSNEFREGPGGGIICGLSILTDNGWVTKWDGAENTDIEAVKGGLSGAMKRAAVQWGIGRYLYNLDEGWANVHDGGANYVGRNQKKGIPAFKWDAPRIPDWALPGGSGKPVEQPQKTQQQAPPATQRPVHHSARGPVNQCTDKQHKFIRSLLKQKATDPDAAASNIKAKFGLEHLPDLSFDQASKVIEELKKRDDVATPLGDDR